jgi:hypothetical protein
LTPLMVQIVPDTRSKSKHWHSWQRRYNNNDGTTNSRTTHECGDCNLAVVRGSVPLADTRSTMAATQPAVLRNQQLEQPKPSLLCSAAAVRHTHARISSCDLATTSAAHQQELGRCVLCTHEGM